MIAWERFEDAVAEDHTDNPCTRTFFHSSPEEAHKSIAGGNLQWHNL